MSFKYVCIPEDINVPLKQLSASKSGGLENDFLRKEAEQFFATAGAIDKSMQRAAVVEQLKAKGIDPAKISDVLNRGAGDGLIASVEIITLSLPTVQNKFVSISLYCDANSAYKAGGPVANVRATELVRACGHKSMVVMGTCFLGKALDDERLEWSRLDMHVEECSIDSSWVQASAKANVGKNLDGYSTSGALNATMQQQQQHSGPASGSKAVEPRGEFTEEAKFSWSQTEDEVEIRMKIPEGLTTKQLSVLFAQTSVCVTKKNAGTGPGTEVPGLDARFQQQDPQPQLHGRINVSESSWSVAEEHEGRILTITLCKANSSGKKVAAWDSLFQ
jgi:hypothetical protein